MRYRLDEDHYDSDSMQLLPTGTEVGDGCPNLWRYPETSPNKSLAGKPRPPSRAMTPLDDEARREYKEKFEGEAPDRDPTKAVPLTGVPRDGQGHVKAAPPGQSNPAPKNPTEKQPLGVNVLKDDSLAKEDPALNKTPEQHSPATSKPAGVKS
jgi:hypothetical protein